MRLYRRTSNGFVTYLAVTIMMLQLATTLALVSITFLSFSNAQDEMELVKAHYDAERGARWFACYVKAGHTWDMTDILEVEHTRDTHIFIKADLSNDKPKHITSLAIRKTATARVHMYVAERDDHTLQIVQIKPY